LVREDMPPDAALSVDAESPSLDLCYESLVVYAWPSHTESIPIRQVIADADGTLHSCLKCGLHGATRQTSGYDCCDGWAIRKFPLSAMFRSTRYVLPYSGGRTSSPVSQSRHAPFAHLLWGTTVAPGFTLVSMQRRCSSSGSRCIVCTPIVTCTARGLRCVLRLTGHPFTSGPGRGSFTQGSDSYAMPSLSPSSRWTSPALAGIALIGTEVRSHLAIPEPGFNVAFHVRQKEI
jgi:hypothetical protein